MLKSLRLQQTLGFRLMFESQNKLTVEERDRYGINSLQLKKVEVEATVEMLNS